MIQKKRRQFQSEIRKKQIEQTLKEKRENLISSAKLQLELASLQNSNENKQILLILERIYLSLKCQQKQQFDQLINNLHQQLLNSPFQASFCLITNCKLLKKIINKLINNRTILTEGENQWQKIQTTLQQYAIIIILNLLSNISYKEVRQEHFYILAQSLWIIFYSQQYGINSQKNIVLLTPILKTINQILRFGNKTILKILKEFNLNEYLSNMIALKLNLQRQSLVLLAEVINVYLNDQHQLSDVKETNQIQGIQILGTQNSQYEQFLQHCLIIIRKQINQVYFITINTFIHIIGKHPHLVNKLHNSTITHLSYILLSSPFNIKKKAVQLICDIIYRDQQLANDVLNNNTLADALYRFLYQYSTLPDEYVDEYTYVVSCIICNLLRNGSQQNLSLLLKHKIWDLALQHLRSGSLFFSLVHIFQYHHNPKFLLDPYLFGVSLLDLEQISNRQSESIIRTIKRFYFIYSQSMDQDESKWIQNLLYRYRLKYVVQSSSQYAQLIPI